MSLSLTQRLQPYVALYRLDREKLESQDGQVLRGIAAGKGQAIGLAGQTRTLQEHTYYLRMQEFVSMVGAHV